jgi:DNA-binding winged helix-turn-helix (wHTH) protein/Tfp pilus assembly protein PilF
MLEPRVMRVLVALGEAHQAVLSRDDLIELCWDGQIVSDHAINRAISVLRHTIEDLSGGSVRLETIARVGFRLVAEAAPQTAALSHSPSQSVECAAKGSTALPLLQRRWSRRAVAGGAVAAGTAAALGYAVWRPSTHIPDPRAVELYRRAQAIQKAGAFETMGQAMEYYKQAVAIDPRYADAWGALALSYRLGLPLRLSDPQEVRVAAQRALALDPDNVDAQLALLALYPYYRHWQEHEARYRAFLRNHPDSAFGHVWLGVLLLNVGRFEDTVTMAKRAIDLDPALQSGWVLLAHACYYAGRDADGDVAIEEARSRWPQDFQLYGQVYGFLLQGKRYNEALAFLRDTSSRPRVLRRDVAEAWMRQADALATGRGLAEAQNRARTLPASFQIEMIGWSPRLALLGLVDELFALLEAYFFGGIVNGTRVPPPGPLDARGSFFLFAPTLAGLRSDPRYASLLARTGLEDYWRKSGTQPDYRSRQPGKK